MKAHNVVYCNDFTDIYELKVTPVIESVDLEKGTMTIKTTVENEKLLAAIKEDNLEDIAKYMAAADVIICRCGALTIAELSCMGKASILIPSPNVAENHQYKNAKVVSDAGGAVLIEEKDLTPKKLIEEIDRILNQPGTLAQMSENMKKMAFPGATDRIWNEICKIRK